MDEGDEEMTATGGKRACAPYACPRGEKAGFTLVEVVVCLLLATLIVGGVMGLFASSLHQQHRMREKAAEWPVLEAAAQVLLTNPQLASKGSLRIDELPGAPVVDIYLTEVGIGSEGEDVQPKAGRLYRAELHYQSSMLELSLLIPEE